MYMYIKRERIAHLCKENELLICDVILSYDCMKLEIVGKNFELFENTFQNF